MQIETLEPVVNKDLRILSYVVMHEGETGALFASFPVFTRFPSPTAANSSQAVFPEQLDGLPQ